MLAPQDAGVAHQPRQAAHRVRAAAEPEEEQLVAGLVLAHEEVVARLDVPRDAGAEGAAGDLVPPAVDAHALVVVHDLADPAARGLPDAVPHADDVR
jgi:hypothetical protein